MAMAALAGPSYGGLTRLGGGVRCGYSTENLAWVSLAEGVLHDRCKLKGTQQPETVEKAIGRPIFEDSLVETLALADSGTYASLLQQCGQAKALSDGKLIHARLCENGSEQETFLGNHLVEMYGKCGCVEDAVRVFNKIHRRNVYSWTMMIGAYAQNGHAEEALHSFRQMLWEGVQPNQATIVELLSVCSSAEALPAAKLIHRHILSCGFESDDAVGVAIVDMYSKCGSLEDAENAFRKLPQRNVVSWSIMIATYVRQGLPLDALNRFRRMNLEGVEPNSITLVTVLDACSSLGALAEGRRIHDCLVASGAEQLDALVETALVNMYAKCGSLDCATTVFSKMHTRDTVSWTSMMAAYARHGHTSDTLVLLEQMNLEGQSPNGITFIAVLHACSHAGVLDEGLSCFRSMMVDYAIYPLPGHYRCLIDLLGRAGFVDEAEEVIKAMPFQAGSVAWTALLGACRLHGKAEVGACAAQNVAHLGPQDSAPYALLSNTLAS